MMRFSPHVVLPATVVAALVASCVPSPASVQVIVRDLSPSGCYRECLGDLAPAGVTYVDSEERAQTACDSPPAQNQILCTFTPGAPIRVIADYGAFQLTDSSAPLPAPSIVLTYDDGASPVTVTGDIPQPLPGSNPPHWVSTTDLFLPAPASLGAHAVLVSVNAGPGFQGVSPVPFPVNRLGLQLAVANCPGAAGNAVSPCDVTAAQGVLGIEVTGPVGLATQNVTIISAINDVLQDPSPTGTFVANGSGSFANVTVPVPSQVGTWSLTAVSAGFVSQTFTVTLGTPSLTIIPPASCTATPCSLSADQGSIAIVVTAPTTLPATSVSLTSIINNVVGPGAAAVPFTQTATGLQAVLSLPVPETPGKWSVRAQAGVFASGPSAFTIAPPASSELIVTNSRCPDGSCSFVADDGLALVTLQVPASFAETQAVLQSQVGGLAPTRTAPASFVMANGMKQAQFVVPVPPMVASWTLEAIAGGLTWTPPPPMDNISVSAPTTATLSMTVTPSGVAVEQSQVQVQVTGDATLDATSVSIAQTLGNEVLPNSASFPLDPATKSATFTIAAPTLTDASKWVLTPVIDGLPVTAAQTMPMLTLLSATPGDVVNVENCDAQETVCTLSATATNVAIQITVPADIAAMNAMVTFEVNGAQTAATPVQVALSTTVGANRVGVLVTAVSGMMGQTWQPVALVGAHEYVGQPVTLMQ